MFFVFLKGLLEWDVHIFTIKSKKGTNKITVYVTEQDAMIKITCIFIFTMLKYFHKFGLMVIFNFVADVIEYFAQLSTANFCTV